MHFYALLHRFNIRGMKHLLMFVSECVKVIRKLNLLYFNDSSVEFSPSFLKSKHNIYHSISPSSWKYISTICYLWISITIVLIKWTFNTLKQSVHKCLHVITKAHWKHVLLLFFFFFCRKHSDPPSDVLLEHFPWSFLSRIEINCCLFSVLEGENTQVLFRM